jgi:hypothetical protein
MSIPMIRLVIAACGIGVALPAEAADIRNQLTPDLIYSHCRAAGVGSETEGTFMLPSGRVTGTVLCTEADLAAANAPVSRRHGDDDDDDDEDHGKRDRHERDRDDD